MASPSFKKLLIKFKPILKDGQRIILIGKVEFMADIGKLNRLKVVKEVDFGVYLDGENHGEILLPRKNVRKHCRINDIVEIFIYQDSEDRIIATTDTPYAYVGEFAFLEAVSVSSVGSIWRTTGGHDRR